MGHIWASWGKRGLQRQFPVISDVRYSTERDIKTRTLAWAVDLMAGHNIVVSEINYAR